MRHLRLAFDERFWEAAEGFLRDLPGEEDEGFDEPVSLGDMVSIDSVPGDISTYFFPECDFLEPDLPEELDLHCYEEMPDLESLTDLSSDEVEPASHFSALELDYPETPGLNCASCDFHRQKLQNEEASCSLCYMRKTAFAVYGMYFSD